MTPEQSLRALALDVGLTDGWAARLGEPHRHYHTLGHIAHMLAHVGPQPSRELLAAIWLHDIVYDPRAPDNEERSAAIAVTDLTDTTIDGGTVEQLVMATKHHAHAPDQSDDTTRIIDLDLLILSESDATYDRYAKAIRLEYGHVPDADYRPGRARVLERMLAGPSLYRSAEFRGREARARANVMREIALLRAG